MTPRCFQSLDNGQRCNAPAIQGSKFCRHHDPQRPLRPVEEKSPETEPLLLPQILDNPSALAALNKVVQALADGRTRRPVAQTLLSAIRFAARLIKEIAEARETVLPVASYSQSNIVALAASSSPRAADLVTTKIPRYSFQTDEESSTTRIVKELLAQSHEFSNTQRPGINRL